MVGCFSGCFGGILVRSRSSQQPLVRRSQTSTLSSCSCSSSSSSSSWSSQSCCNGRTWTPATPSWSTESEPVTPEHPVAAQVALQRMRAKRSTPWLSESDRHDHWDESELVRATVHKDDPSMSLGAAVALVGGSHGQVVIVNVKEDGLLQQWNDGTPSDVVVAGDIVVEANGQTTAMAIMEQLASSTSLKLVVRHPQSRTWQAQMSQIGVEATQNGTGHSRMVENKFMCLPTVCAGDAGVDHCAICMESVTQDQQIAQLKCGHGFHQTCLARWIVQGKRHVCPLCIRPVD